MELLELATSAFALASPFLLKSGEKVAEKVGEEVWDFIRKPFTSEKQSLLLANANSVEQQEIFKQELIQKISEDAVLEKELRLLIQDSQKKLSNSFQQNITNNGTVEKQINIQNQTGNIQM